MTPAKRTMPTTTGQTKPKRAPHPLLRVCVCHLDPTPATLLNKHGRTTTHLPNESHEWQQVETTTQAPDEPHTRRSGCGILLNPHPPTEATTPPNENTTTGEGEPQRQYHMPAQVGVCHPSGLLFATQFTQIALVVTEKAAFDDMHSKDLVQPNCTFTGHSLGEYSALASIADVLPVSSLIDVMFYHGITMQCAMERDAHNRSNYAMCAVNPSRISKTFNEAALCEVVEVIAHCSNVLLEIVNYNVEGSQYVCAGDLLALQSLTNVLNYLKKENIDIQKLMKTYSIDRVKEMLQEIVDNCIKAARQKQEADDGYIVLEYLSKKINSAHLNPDLPVGKYIPNLIAKPFEISREYAQIIYDQTSSPRLDKVLKNWECDNWTSLEQRQNLAYTILVELLAYQFASPVWWIETQDLLFSQYHFKQLIELGPGKNTKEIYYQFEDEAAAADTDAAVDSPATTASTASIPVAAAVVAPALPSGPVASIADETLKALNTLHVIIAQKLKKKVEEIPLSKSIKDLVGGKSTLQNEILGDLNLEFVSAPEKGEELPLDKLGSSLSTGYSGALGKHTTGLISCLIGGKMPSGFNLSAIKAYLTKTWGLGPSRSDGVLLLGLTVEPPKRLGSEAEAKTWLNAIVVAYAQQAGISLSSGATSGGGGSSGGAVINNKEFIKFQVEQHEFARHQVELYMRYLDLDPCEGARTVNNEKSNMQALQDKLDAINCEHGDAYINGIQPVFKPLKARHFDSSWNWVRQDALIMWYNILHGRISTVDREITARCIAIINRADKSLSEYMQYYVDCCDPGHGETYQLGKEFGQQLINNCREAVGHPPLYKDVTFPTAPRTEVTPAGNIVYMEVVRENVRKLEAYVKEMAMGGATPGVVNIQKVQDDILKLWNVIKSQLEISQEQKNWIKALLRWHCSFAEEEPFGGVFKNFPSDSSIFLAVPPTSNIYTSYRPT
ncbi:hypothetical protein BS47DRAFT_1365687 [Hydnum rufescens UP504]|uniref:Carrier domain-containing protein n=1 Tax=Hydnum rufescens UP504 TaxID=1448309 RepID=A0A9P6DPA1_9AGAM|nr:hypothetical protein BS47DRAFT_1365687 [Hydnum rufescens UP504]